MRQPEKSPPYTAGISRYSCYDTRIQETSSSDITQKNVVITEHFAYNKTGRLTPVTSHYCILIKRKNTMSKKQYVRTYNVGRVLDWLQQRGITLVQVSKTCDINKSYLSTILRKYRERDMSAKTDKEIAKRLLVLVNSPMPRGMRSHATDSEMSLFRKTVSELTDHGMTLTHIMNETGLNRATIQRGMSKTITRASVQKLMQKRGDLMFDAQNGFGKSRNTNSYTIKNRAQSCKDTVRRRHASDAETIREYLAKNPDASRTKCAHALGWSVRKVSNIDDEYHLFSERSKKRPVDEDMISRYIAIKEDDPTKSNAAIAREMGISQKSTTKISKILRQRAAMSAA